jgi:hypothetical protein
MQRRLAAPLVGLVEDIVDDQRYIVHDLKNGGRANEAHASRRFIFERERPDGVADHARCYSRQLCRAAEFLRLLSPRLGLTSQLTWFQVSLTWALPCAHRM